MFIDSAGSLRALSTVLGWIYVFSWSASFYPQPYLNWQRRSTLGLTVDFPALNVLGFVSYTISTTCFMYSKTVRKQYAARHLLSPEPTVRFNDFAFAVHALILVVLTYSQFYPQIWGFKVVHAQHMNIMTKVIILVSIFSILAGSVAVGVVPSTRWQWIDVISLFGHIKLVATFVKYTPQVWHNFKRKSTEGWSIGQILFDFAGGILSITQLLIDASFQGDWGGVTGNPTKLFLGLISLCFDLIFIAQHYVLYDNGLEMASDVVREGIERPLLEHVGSQLAQG